MGHGMRTCTRGIWMATAILECQQFAIVLLDTERLYILDTEGIDAIRASETTAMSLLTLTTLLSSYLIYNSKKVPQKVDLDKMRCFTQLSTSLLAQRGQSMSAVVTRKFFPRFLWLLRDVALDMTNRQGELISPNRIPALACWHLHLGNCLTLASLSAASFPLWTPGVLHALFPCPPSSPCSLIWNIMKLQQPARPAEVAPKAQLME